MANKPVSADKILVDLYLGNGAFETIPNQMVNPKLAEAKRQLAEAVEWVIGKPGRGHVPDECCCSECDLMAEQRKRLAEWLGKEV